MTNIITRSSFQADLLPLVKNWFGEYSMQDSLVSKICDVQSSDQYSETDALYVGMGTLQAKPEGVAFAYDNAKQQWTPRYTHTTYGLGFKITMEMMQDGTAFKNANRFTKRLKTTCQESMNIDAASIINLGHTTGNTMDGGDGVILFSASHPSIYGNQSNVIASNADLSEASVETLYIQIRKARDDRGLRLNLKPTKLVVPVDSEPEANRIVYSQGRVNTPDNDVNYINRSSMFPGGIIASPYFTDDDAFTILTDCADGIKWYNRMSPTIDSDNEFDTKNACYSLIARWSRGWSDWRGAYSSPGV